MRAIETPFAEIALWKMAENLPNLLLEMAKDRPLELLKRIERTLEKALDWKETAIKNGADEQEANEIMIDLLNPSWCPPNPPQGLVSETKMRSIITTLRKLSKDDN